MTLSQFLGKMPWKKGGQTKTELTSINLRFGQDMHALPGKSIDGEEFDLEIPFKNRLGSGMLPSHLKGPSITIKEVRVEKPFSLISSEPGAPLSVPYMGEILFKIRVRAPGGSYTGPLTLAFESEKSDDVNIDIEKITLTNGSRTVEVEETSSNMILKKSQIIRRDMQAYKILSFGQEVANVSASKPFEVVSTEPKAPFSIDRKDSYIIKIYIKCPDFNYSGPMEIRFS